MKITFKTQEEAQEFCKKLAAQGIHSHTFGTGVPKTAQNGSVFLTKQDLAKMSQSACLCKNDNTAKSAYETIVHSIAEVKHKATDDQREQATDTTRAHL